MYSAGGAELSSRATASSTGTEVLPGPAAPCNQALELAGRPTSRASRHPVKVLWCHSTLARACVALLSTYAPAPGAAVAGTGPLSAATSTSSSCAAACTTSDEEPVVSGARPSVSIESPDACCCCLRTATASSTGSWALRWPCIARARATHAKALIALLLCLASFKSPRASSTWDTRSPTSRALSEPGPRPAAASCHLLSIEARATAAGSDSQSLTSREAASCTRASVRCTTGTAAAVAWGLLAASVPAMAWCRAAGSRLMMVEQQAGIGAAGAAPACCCCCCCRCLVKFMMAGTARLASPCCSCPLQDAVSRPTQAAHAWTTATSWSAGDVDERLRFQMNTCARPASAADS
mmetsp:Transcript_32631/g.72080  ORF Transcript_32631/g.72080 Transcript_32631/m.72080 type:complete len:352 (-) Transcript_32631:1095-2150(-)